jgi:argininosuccinate lyase
MTGSSLMPQKQNPDLLEMVRSQAGVGLGAVMGLGAVLKAVPPGYNRDLQEDKAATAAVFSAARAALSAMTLVVGHMTVNRDRMASALSGGFVTATEVADYLVRRGVAFREAHRLAGLVVRAAEAAGCELWELPLDEYRHISAAFGEDVLLVARPEGAVASRDVPGGTAPARVAEALASARAALAVERAWLEQVTGVQADAEARLLAAAPG